MIEIVPHTMCHGAIRLNPPMFYDIFCPRASANNERTYIKDNTVAETGGASLPEPWHQTANTTRY